MHSVQVEGYFAPCFYFILLPLGVYHIISTSCPSYLLPLEGHFIYCHLRLIIFYCHLSSLIMLLFLGAKSQTGMNISELEKEQFPEDFLIKKIASLQNFESVLQNIFKKPLQWPGAIVYRFILCLTAFILRLSSRSESSRLVLCFILFFFLFLFLFKSQDKQ